MSKCYDTIILTLFIFLATKAYQQIKTLFKPRSKSVFFPQMWNLETEDQGEIKMTCSKLSYVTRKLSAGAFSLGGPR